jgi:hypothetical protein
LLLGHVLTAEEEHEVSRERVPELSRLLGADRFPQIDAADVRTERRRQRFHLDRSKGRPGHDEVGIP